MTIEEALSRLALNTGRIATALEALASSQGIVSDEPDETPQNELDLEPAKAPAKKKTKKKTKKKVVNKTEEKPATKLTVLHDVRPVALKLKKAVSHNAVKHLLEKYGATTLHNLDEKHYQSFIDDALRDIDINEDF
jgi:hypothetical protein